MFENMLYQSAADQLGSDLHQGSLPKALLFSGPEGAGKLSAALELSRGLSCEAEGGGKGAWNCGCPSCVRHRHLVHQDLTIAGPRNCTLEVAAARKTLLAAAAGAGPLPSSTVYLFIRSVRKLTARFNPVLWEGDDKVGKAAPLLVAINEELEELSPDAPPLEAAALEKRCDSLLAATVKLESGFLYDTLPVSHIRNAAAWARYTQKHGTKVLVVENADRLQEGARNAMLKTLEEPPEGALFILTTSRRSALIATVLSRVRPYHFVERSPAQQREVLERVFRVGPEVTAPTVASYFRTFLPLDSSPCRALGAAFLRDCLEGRSPDVRALVKEAHGFEPRLLLTIFFEGMITALAQLRRNTALAGSPPSPHLLGSLMEREGRLLMDIHTAHLNVTIYSQSPPAVLERLKEALRYGS
jgi:DNA polymerase-3 subunit gamma/tau